MPRAPDEQFLNLIGQRLRRGRDRFKPPVWSVYENDFGFAEIWIPSNGCRWDFQGQCTMCNYGFPQKVLPEHSIEAVERGLAQLSKPPEVLWVGAFNMFDDREVPREVRRAIFELLAQSGADTIITETHSCTISYTAVRECVEILDNQTFGIEVGIESMNDFVRRWCINKDISKSQIVAAVRDVHKAGGVFYANLLLGAPFLSELEAIEDVITSIRECDALGIDYFVIFPNHVKAHTVVQWLYDHDEYTPPSLWALVEVLRRIDGDTDLLPRLLHAWIAPVDHPGAVDGVAPEAGSETAQVITHLTNYQANQSRESLGWLFDHRSHERDQWQADLFNGQKEPLVERLEKIFPKVGRAVLGNAWWELHGERVIDRLYASWREARFDTFAP